MVLDIFQYSMYFFYIKILCEYFQIGDIYSKKYHLRNINWSFYKSLFLKNSKARNVVPLLKLRVMGLSKKDVDSGMCKWILCYEYVHW